MSLLSTLAGALEGTPNANSGTAPSLVVSQIISMIQQQPGGLSGLLQSFQQGGLGHLFQSWVGTGQNLPVTPDQLRSTLGADWLSRIAQATGLPQGQVESHLSTLLPQIVDHLTPNGQLPQGDLGSELAQVAQRFLHR
jgi:uncharacterized protein YidB (DUF937 family)